MKSDQKQVETRVYPSKTITAMGKNHKVYGFFVWGNSPVPGSHVTNHLTVLPAYGGGGQGVKGKKIGRNVSGACTLKTDTPAKFVSFCLYD